MKKKICILLGILLLIGIIVLIILRYNVNNESVPKIKVISHETNKTYYVKAGDKVEGVSIIEIKDDKVIVKVGTEENRECIYGEKYEFWPDSENGTIMWEYQLTTLTFEKQ